MGNQTVIAFQHRDDALMRAFDNKRMLDEVIEAQAQMLYRARALWIGGHALPWGLLTQGQRDGYRLEIHNLIKKAKGEQ